MPKDQPRTPPLAEPRSQERWLDRVRRRRALSWAVIASLAIAIGITSWEFTASRGAGGKYRTVAATRADVTQTVSANGTLNPVVLVNVGTQVSGTVKKLHVDFNDRVKAGQVLLELDPALVASARMRASSAGEDAIWRIVICSGVCMM